MTPMNTMTTKTLPETRLGLMRGLADLHTVLPICSANGPDTHPDDEDDEDEDSTPFLEEEDEDDEYPSG